MNNNAKQARMLDILKQYINKHSTMHGFKMKNGHIR